MPYLTSGDACSSAGISDGSKANDVTNVFVGSVMRREKKKYFTISLVDHLDGRAFDFLHNTFDENEQFTEDRNDYEKG